MNWPDSWAPMRNFLRPHRSYLINMDYIGNLSSRSIVMQNQEEIPIPHGKYSDIKNHYLEYLFDRSAGSNLKQED